MLTRKKPDTLATTLTITGQNEADFTFDVTYYNRKQTEVENTLQADGAKVHDTILYVVKEWDSEYPLTLEGIAEMEDDRPGMVVAIINGFHQARRVALAKN